MASLRSSRVPSFMLMHTVYKTHGGPPHGADKIKALSVNRHFKGAQEQNNPSDKKHRQAQTVNLIRLRLLPRLPVRGVVLLPCLLLPLLPRLLLLLLPLIVTAVSWPFGGRGHV